MMEYQGAMAKVRVNPATTRATRIRAWRKHRGMTLETVAERIGVTAGSLSQLERGDISYTQPMLEALAGVFNCEPHDLLIREPAETESVWGLWSQATPGQKRQIVDIVRTLLAVED
jgi:transcriptional regulator with XRE-family HTH domain